MKKVKLGNFIILVTAIGCLVLGVGGLHYSSGLTPPDTDNSIKTKTIINGKSYILIEEHQIHVDFYSSIYAPVYDAVLVMCVNFVGAGIMIIIGLVINYRRELKTNPLPNQ